MKVSSFYFAVFAVAAVLRSTSAMADALPCAQIIGTWKLLRGTEDAADWVIIEPPHKGVESLYLRVHTKDSGTLPFRWVPVDMSQFIEIKKGHDSMTQHIRSRETSQATMLSPTALRVLFKSRHSIFYIPIGGEKLILDAHTAGDLAEIEITEKLWKLWDPGSWFRWRHRSGVYTSHLDRAAETH